MREMACDKMRENNEVISTSQRQGLKKGYEGHDTFHWRSVHKKGGFGGVQPPKSEKCGC